MKFSRTNVFVVAFAVFALVLNEVNCKSARNYNKKQTRGTTNDVDSQDEDEGTSIFAWLWDNTSDVDTDSEKANDDKKPAQDTTSKHAGSPNTNLEAIRKALSEHKKRASQESNVNLQAEHDLVVRSFWDWLSGSSSTTDTAADGSEGSENSVVISNSRSNTDVDDNKFSAQSGSGKKPAKPKVGGLLNANMNILRRAFD